VVTSSKPFNRLLSGRLVTVCAAAALLAVTSVAQAGDAATTNNGDTTPGAGAMAFDLAAGRPLGLGATILGTAIFIVGLPFEALSGDVAGPARRLVVEPAQFTFTRKLGEMD
jgi:hypothetical protein